MLQIKLDAWQSPAWARPAFCCSRLKLVPLHNTRQSLPAVCYITFMGQGWQCLPMQKFMGWTKNSPTVLSHLWTKVHQIWGMKESRCKLTSFFPIVDIMFRCRDMFGQSSKSVHKVQSRSQKTFLCPQPVGELGPNFSNSNHNGICVKVWLRSVQWPQRLGIEKRKNHMGKI